MSKKDIVNKFSRTAHKVGFKLKKHSPEILVVAGVAGTVTSAVMACKATTKFSMIVEEKNEQLDALQEVVEKLEAGETVKYKDEDGNVIPYTIEDVKKDARIYSAKYYLNVAKLYAPSVAVGAISIAAILGGHHILRKRNVALGAAYATVNRTFKDYRGRVVERFGEGLDRELRYNIKSKEIEEVEVNEKGKEKVVKKNIDVVESEYIGTIRDNARFFDQSCKAWEKDAVANMTFLKGVEAWANRVLETRGWLSLNEVYMRLGFDPIPNGQAEGWVYNIERPVGANRVDFGIYNTHRANRAFVNGYEPVILLEFNTDEESIIENM